MERNVRGTCPKNSGYLFAPVLFSSGFMNDMSMSARGSTKDVILDDYKRVTELFTGKHTYLP